jgi:hypothetical protein
MAVVPTTPEPDEDIVPVFSSWPRIYGAVILSALLVMALIAVFSSYPF